MHKAALPLALSLALGACAGEEIIEDGGVVITRSACPAVAIPASTGDITLFNPPASRDARAIDVVAFITKLRPGCADSGNQIVATATFEVHGQRRGDLSAQREVIIPYYTTMVQAGTNIVAKRTSRVALRFAAGQARASTSAQSTSQISRVAVTLPEEVRKRLQQKRKAGSTEAAVDPMTDPTVRAAVQRASFEMLVGFQLTPEQLAYNATR